MSKTINLEGKVAADSWLRLSGATQDGGTAEIDGVERTNEGWLVRIAALDGVAYRVRLDTNFDLIDVEGGR